MTWEKWEIRSTEITSHFLLWNQKTKSLIMCQALTSLVQQRKSWDENGNFNSGAMSCNFLYCFNSPNFHLILFFLVFLLLWLFSVCMHGFFLSQAFLPEIQDGFSTLVASFIQYEFPGCTVPDRFWSAFVKYCSNGNIWPKNQEQI